MRLFVDIDGTLNEGSKYPKNINSAIRLDIVELIKKLQNKYDIVIWSARHEEDREITEKWLSELGINPEQIILAQKSDFDYIIDNHAFNPDCSECMKKLEVIK